MPVSIAAVLPLALVVSVGVCLGRKWPLDVSTLARISIFGMLPALVLSNLIENTLAWSSAIAIVLALWVNLALLYGVAIVVGRCFNATPDERKSLVATTMFANVGNMGLPFVLFALGEAGLERAIVYMVASSLTIATVFPILLKGEGVWPGVRYTLRLPVFWAVLTGMGLQITRVELPEAIGRGVTLLGDGTIPLALLVLGIQLSRTTFAFGRFELIAASLRLLVSPTLTYGVGRSLGLSELDLQAIVLQAAMPVAVNSLIWVTELGGDSVRVSRAIVLSTLLSFLTLPCVLWLSSQ